MSSRYWGYLGPTGEGGPVSTDELALFLRERLITVDTPVRPAEGMRWEPLAYWLPELAPFAARPDDARARLDPGPSNSPQPFADQPVEPRAPAALEEPPFVLAPAPGPAAPSSRRGWTDRAPHPWRRYGARLLDAAVLGYPTALLLGAIGGVVAPTQTQGVITFLTTDLWGRVADIMLNVLLVIPAHAILLGLTGSTPGKWLFGIRIVRPDGRPIGVFTAFWRELRVWFQGLAMGIPFVSLFTLFAGFSWLKDDGHTPWDPPKRRVALHRPQGAAQVLLALLGLALLIAVRVWEAQP